MLSRLRFAFILSAALTVSGPALAEEGEQEAENAPSKQETPDGPVQEMLTAVKGLSDGLTPQQIRHFFMVYNNYNIVSTVRMVRENIAEAVKACAAENPDLKSKLNNRFSRWTGAVMPVMSESEANINNMVFAQDYVQPGEIKKIFDLVDKARAHAAAQENKEPATTKEACNYLHDNMDNTQRHMVSMLRGTLASRPPAPAAGPDGGTPEDTGEL